MKTTTQLIDLFLSKGVISEKEASILKDHLIPNPNNGITLGVGALATKHKIGRSNVKQKLDAAAQRIKEFLKTLPTAG